MATSNEAEKARHALRRRRRLRQVLGAVVCVLVVIGLASVISGGVRLTASLFDDTEEKEEFELRLQTLVSLDPEPFDSLESANRARLLDAAIWSVIQQNSDSLDTYERDEVGAMYLPTLDIDRAVASLYGPDFHFNYETFTDNGLTFQYVPEKNAYLLPILIVAIMTGLMYVYLQYSKHGYEIAVVGESQRTASYAGIKVDRVIIRTMVLSGAICGLMGYILTAGISHTLTTTIVDSRGFTAVMVSWMSKFNPLIMIAASLLLVTMERGASEISTAFSLNQSFADILTGIILFFIIATEFFITYKVTLRKSSKKEA